MVPCEFIFIVVIDFHLMDPKNPVQFDLLFHSVQVLSGPRPNIKTVFSWYGDSHVKDKTVGETILSLTWDSL